jgi:hypothetical protein
MGFPLLVVVPFIKAIPSPTGRIVFPCSDKHEQHDESEEDR